MNQPQTPDNEVARLREEIEIERKRVTAGWDEIARLRELLNRAIDIAEKLEKDGLSASQLIDLHHEIDAVKELAKIAPAPEEPSWKCNHQFTRYDDDTRDFVCTDCCAHLDVTATPEEPTIKQSQIVQSDPVPTQPPTQNEWRELGPDEVICEGDEVQPKHHSRDGTWIKVWNHEIGATPEDQEAMRYRTHRPLPKPIEIERVNKQEEKAPDDLHAWMRLQEEINKEIAGEIKSIREMTELALDGYQYLRDEIQKLKEAQ